MQSTDVVIIGGGIVGLATAYSLVRRHPDRRILILEKEASLAPHQTGRNSGVLHSGIYYKPGSLKARNCRAGKAAMEAFCEAEGVPYDRCGKVIVATHEGEVETLEGIYARGQANGVECTVIGPERLAELEPGARGVRAIHVPEAGIVDYPLVCDRLAARVREGGGTIRTGAAVIGIEERPGRVVVETTAGAVEADYLVNCGGLHADRLAALGAEPPEVRIVPFRGEYFVLRPEAESLCRGLIYPVPDPSFPFLGVHFTRMIRGGVECGPNAVLAFAREGYTLRDVNLRDLLEIVSYSGFRRLAARYWRTGLGELYRSASKRAFVRALQRLVPAIEADDLTPAPAGVRAQAVRPDGAMVDDFLIRARGRRVDVLNAPSPAATAALPIGEHITGQLEARFA